MEKITKENVERLQNELKEKLQKKLDDANASLGKIHYTPYFEKRKKRLSKSFVKTLQDSANNKYEVADEYGVYRQGTFMYGSAIVTVDKEQDLWSLHIISENPITLPIIKDVRTKFLPDDITMAMLFGSRAEGMEMRGVLLYQIPKSMEGEECTTSE